MLPIKVVLKGFRGIKDGMGRDSYTLDLAVVGDAEIVAFAGPNGSGKTTVLDNLQPYPILPSRANAYSLAAFSMYDHIIGPEASKELIWTHNGKTYQSMNVWRMNGKRKSAEAFLFEQLPDTTWQPVKTASGVLSDGKVETFVNALVEILGTADAYFSSVFAAQGRRKLFEYKEGELKDLLAELLNQGDLQEKSAKANRVVSGLKAAVDTLSTSLMDIEADKATRSTVEQQLVDARSLHATTRQHLQEAEKNLGIAKTELAVKQALKDQNASVEAQRTALTKRLDESNQLIRERVAAAADVVKAFNNATTLAQQHYTQASKEREGQILRSQEKIRQRDQLIAQREAINNAHHQVSQLTEQINKAEADVKLARQRLDDHRETEGAIKVLEINIVSARTNYSSALTQLRQIKVKAELAEAVPCNGTDLQPRCRLLIDALTAKSEIAPAEAAYKLAESAGQSLKERMTPVAARLEVGKESNQHLMHAERLLDQYRATKREAEKLASQLPQLVSAEADIVILREEITTHQANAEATRLAFENANQQRELEHELVRATPDIALTRAEAAKLDASTELVKLPISSDDGIAIAQSRITITAAAVDVAQQAFANAQSSATFTEAKLAATVARIVQAAPTVSKRENLRAELATWQLVAKALGRDGVIAMLIDEAGPTLAGLANDILLACYGRRYTLSIVTQKARANGELTEAFDILVHDADSEESKSLSLMSGGQKVWINEALTRAIALYCSQNSQRAYGALFCDESDGPLDPERKQAFFAMQREVLKLGGYKRAFFISQTPEITAQADAVINL